MYACMAHVTIQHRAVPFRGGGVSCLLSALRKGRISICMYCNAMHPKHGFEEVSWHKKRRQNSTAGIVKQSKLALLGAEGSYEHTNLQLYSGSSCTAVVKVSR